MARLYRVPTANLARGPLIVRMRTRLALTLAIAIVASLAGSAAAHAAAGTVTVYDGGEHKEIRYTGSADANEVSLGGSIADHRVTIVEAGIADPGAGADPGNICELTAPNTLSCTDPKLGANGWFGGSASTGQGADTATVNGTQQWLVEGGEGEDRLTGSDQADDLLSGGADNDVVEGRGNSGLPFAADRLAGDGGNDVVRGGAGDDYADGGAGNDDVSGDDGDDYLGGDADVDAMHGGAGDDWLNPGSGEGELLDGGDGSDELLCYGGAGSTYDGGAGLDLIDCIGGIESGPDAGPDDYLIDLGAGIANRTNHAPTTSTLRAVEDAETGWGNDVLIGDDSANSLSAGPGNDSVDGRGGTDYIWAYNGNDTIETGDGAADRADAGGGDDTCHSDTLDTLFTCEAVTLAPIPSGTSGDRTAPKCKITRVHGSRAKGRIDLRATCDEASTLGAEAIGRLTKAKRGALASRVGDVTLGAAARRAAANTRVRVVVRISKRYRRALAKGARIRVALHATDALGNASTVSRKVRMR